MRFTSPDPAASPFYNLHHYVGNNPAGAYDPDGLQPKATTDAYWELHNQQEARNRGEATEGPNFRGYQRAGTGTSTVEVTFETFKELHANTTVGIAEGADPNTAAGQRVLANSQTMAFLPDITLALGVLGKGSKLLRHGDEVTDAARGHRALSRTDDVVDVSRGSRKTNVSARSHALSSVGAMGDDLAPVAREYEISTYEQLRRVARGTSLDAHHVGQKALMAKFVKNYNVATAPAILVPQVGHTRRSPIAGIVSRNMSLPKSARDVVARDVRELRRVYPAIPNSQLKRLIRMNERMYDEVLPLRWR